MAQFPVLDAIESKEDKTFHGLFSGTAEYVCVTLKDTDESVRQGPGDGLSGEA